MRPTNEAVNNTVIFRLSADLDLLLSGWNAYMPCLWEFRTSSRKRVLQLVSKQGVKVSWQEVGSEYQLP